MKKIKLFITLAFILPLYAATTSSCAIVHIFQCMGKEELRLFNWGQYIDPDVLSEFEQAENVCVSYSTFDSNESAITKMEQTQFDVVIPSDYAIEQLSATNKLEKINWDLITNFDKEEDVAPVLKQLLDKLATDDNPFDFLEYASPYMWGYLGILYNSDVIDEEEIAEQGWEILRNNEYRSAYYDSSRDGFAVPLSQLGYDINTTSSSQIDEAKEWLLEQKAMMGNKIVYLTDQILDDMIGSRHDLALVYSGDAIYIMDNNEDMAYFRPEDKVTNVFADGMVIPKGANIELAHKFINFMMDEEISIANSSFIGYSSAHAGALEYLSETDFVDFADVYNFEVLEQDQMFRYSPVNKQLIDVAWSLVRA